MNQRARSFVLRLLRGYKWALSPLLPPACRYVPTCSDYAMEAVDRHGVFRGSLMTIWRVLRCHPFCKVESCRPAVAYPTCSARYYESA